MAQSQTNDEENDQIRTSEEEGDHNQRSDEETSENQSDEEWRDEEEPRCIVSDPAHPHNISRVAGRETKQDCISCGKRGTCWDLFNDENFHFYCPTCQVEFHARCHAKPSKMIHPYHPQHPLTFTFLNKKTGMVVETNCGEYDTINIDFYNFTIKFQKPFVPITSSNIIFDKCTWCGDDLREWFYRCLVCNFSLDIRCAKNIPPLTIKKPKSHHHSLSLFPRPLSFPCNACGLVELSEPGYACYQCNYVVHRICIDLPRVIKITRHPHRLSHTPYLPTEVSTCRVCYKNVDIKYGQYSCSHEDCSYVVHSKCATHTEVWDGEELEWEPEESAKVIAPYKKVGPGLIEHFCHDEHYLKLEKYNGPRDSRKKCQACMRSITFHEFYSCIECDYFLHEVCANLPRQLDHAVHNHSLSLNSHPYSLERHDDNELSCRVCERKSSGWRYICEKDGCLHLNKEVKIDINCILVPECFTHESHPEHLLFISTSYAHIICHGCKKVDSGYHRLCCTICKFAICYKCSTIPNEVYYKFDEHLLSLCYGESSADAIYWCEVCEKRLNPTKWFYTDKEFCVTIHRECLFGDSTYMKSGHNFYIFQSRVKVVSNDSSSRPTCRICQHYCPQHVYFKKYKDGAVFVFCSFSCLDASTFSISY